MDAKTISAQDFGGDGYKRILVRPNVYQCGCKWKRLDGIGDVLFECVFHKQATVASVKEFERKRRSQGVK